MGFILDGEKMLLASLKRKIGEEKQLKVHFINADRDYSTRISDDERSLGSCNTYGKQEHA